MSGHRVSVGNQHIFLFEGCCVERADQCVSVTSGDLFVLVKKRDGT